MPVLINGIGDDAVSPLSPGGVLILPGEIPGGGGGAFLPLTGGTLTGALVINTPSAIPLEMTSQQTTAGTETAAILRNSTGTAVITVDKLAGDDSPQINFPESGSPGMRLGNVFSGLLAGSFGIRSDNLDFSFGSAASSVEAIMFFNFGDVGAPPHAPDPSEVFFGSGGVSGNANVLSLTTDDGRPDPVDSTIRCLHVADRIAPAVRFFSFSPPLINNDPVIMRFGVNTSGLDLQGDLEVEGDVGFYNTTPVAQSAAYTVNNATPTRTLDPTAATAEDVGNFVASIIADLQNNGLFQ